MDKGLSLKNCLAAVGLVVVVLGTTVVARGRGDDPALWFLVGVVAPTLLLVVLLATPAGHDEPDGPPRDRGRGSA